jgi:hypothetical protein
MSWVTWLPKSTIRTDSDGCTVMGAADRQRHREWQGDGDGDGFVPEPLCGCERLNASGASLFALAKTETRMLHFESASLSKVII